MKNFSNLPDRSGTASLAIQRIENESVFSANDQIVLEEPLEIRLEYGPREARLKKSISITMRTPGYDFELAVGFLFTEGIIRKREDIEAIHYCGPDLNAEPLTNIVRIELNPEVPLDLLKLSRHFYTSSSCGVCGKSSIEALKTESYYTLETLALKIPPERIHRLPTLLRKAQGIFDSTGGLHASALFSLSGELLLVREDVGRHNALDKIIGHALLHDFIPLNNFILLVSGRASFELIQKASMAAIPIFAAVGAPSSLAVELAKEMKMTLMGFVRNYQFNIYSGAERIDCPQENLS